MLLRANEAADTGTIVAAPRTIRAHAFVRNWGTTSDPAALLCADGNVYVVKAVHPGNPKVGRMIVAERAVGLLGHLLGAPVPDIGLVDVPQELIAAQAELRQWASGIAHGSRFIDNATEREGLAHVQEPINRSRFARLAVLYGWAQATDHQFIYEKMAPYRVYSHDHGHFFNGPRWSADSLNNAPLATLDTNVMHGCNLISDEITGAVARLRAVVEHEVADILAGVPATWGVTEAERAALLAFFIRRRDQILALYSPPTVAA
jgi:hypothetical protein